jgi:hypothetical protein
MAKRLQPTLAEIRSSILIRCGLSTSGSVPAASQAIIDERIRSAQEQLYLLHPQVARTVDGTITLSANETDYDIPDDTDEDNIAFVGVRRSSDGEVVQLDQGFTTEEATTFSDTASMPLRYKFIDGVLRIHPTPNVTEYDVLCLTYRTVPTPLVDDDERISIDAEALRMFAEIQMKEHFGGVDTMPLRADLGRYLDGIKSKQSDGTGFQMGGKVSAVTRTPRRNKFIESEMRTGLDSRHWRPW